MRRYSFILLTVALSVLTAVNSQAQYITTFAGTPDYTGYSGDGGQATAAFLYSPSDIVLDAIGNLYITDFYNNVIRKVDTTGIISTIAGTGFGAGGMATGAYSGDGGQATAAELNGPFGIALDSAGNIYFADGYNHVVRAISTSGVIRTIAGQNSIGYSGDGGPATAATLDNPVGVAIDKAGNIYIADDHNNAVRKISGDGVITTFAGNHSAGYSGDGGPSTAAAISDPVGVGVDTDGNVYIADAGNNVVRKINVAGMISTFAGDTTAGYSGDGGQATAAKLRSPERVTVDDTGNVYISDFYNNVVRKVNAAGIISTFAGIGTGAGTMGMSGAYSGDGGLATAAELYVPQGVAVSHSGRVYICDRGNEIIRIVGPDRDHTGITVLNNHDVANLAVYPNPTKDGCFTFILSTKTNDPVDVVVVNVLGEVVKQISTTANHPLNIYLNAPRGVYFLSATTPGGKWNKQLAIE